MGPGPPVDEPVAADQPDPLAAFRLTERERKILDLVTTGRSNRQIAEQLFISPKTLSVHVSNLLAKLGVVGRLEAAAMAHRLSGRPISTGGKVDPVARPATTLGYLAASPQI